MTTLPTNLTTPFIDLLLSVADDKLMLGHRNSDWTGLGPILEEDIAFSSLAQDEIAHALALYELVGTLTGRTADQIAFGRAPEAYRCAAMVTSTDEFDWATAICRQLFCDHFDLLRLERCAASTHAELAALSKRLHAEERLHVEHVDAWVQRLGRGTDDSRQRMQDAIDALAPAASMLCEPVDDEIALVSEGLYPPLARGDLFECWRDDLLAVADRSGLRLAIEPADPARRGGRRGAPGPDLAPLLDEMCEVFRQAPTASW
jgi:ring-1,2-phenylacetyl-CoA epoxidase subunit PaaC